MSWRSRIVQVLGVEFTGARAIDGLHWVVCAIPDSSKDMRPEEWGWGVKTTKYEAATVAVAELVERTIMESSSQFGLVYASARELGESDWLLWLSPHGRASDGLLGFSFDNVKIYWVEGREFEIDAGGDFVLGERRFVPAHMVFVHSDESDPVFGEAWEFRNQSSVGWAVHTDRQVALKKAYCEVVEHHVKMLYFFAGCLGEEFSFAAGHYLYGSCEVLRQRGMQIFVYKMPGGGVDVYNAYLESSGVPWLIAGSGDTPEKAFTEAIMLAEPKLYDKMCKDAGLLCRDEITDINVVMRSQILIPGWLIGRVRSGGPLGKFCGRGLFLSDVLLGRILQ